MSNILGKHVYSIKIQRNHILGIAFCAKAASVTDVFEIFALLSFGDIFQTFRYYDASGNGARYGEVDVLSTYMCPLDTVQGKPPSWGKIHLRSHEDERAGALEG